jgi:hypothetical protein
MEEEWTAQPVDVQGRTEIALRLTDGALVYLHPDIARRFAAQIQAAAIVAEYRDTERQLQAGLDTLTDRN